MEKKKNKHHIIPRSRLIGKGVEGVCRVDAKIHDLSHQLHGNRTPREILEWYNEYLWGGIYEITISKKKFGGT